LKLEDFLLFKIEGYFVLLSSAITLKSIMDDDNKIFFNYLESADNFHSKLNDFKSKLFEEKKNLKNENSLENWCNQIKNVWDSIKINNDLLSLKDIKDILDLKQLSSILDEFTTIKIFKGDNCLELIISEKLKEFKNSKINDKDDKIIDEVFNIFIHLKNCFNSFSFIFITFLMKF
jgi:hypothetical protein